MPDRVVLGRITGAHALRGEVRVQFFGDGPHNLLRLSEVWLGEDRSDTNARRFEVLRAAMGGRSGEIRLALAGVVDRDAAAALRAHLLAVADDDLYPVAGDVRTGDRPVPAPAGGLVVGREKMRED